MSDDLLECRKHSFPAGVAVVRYPPDDGDADPADPDNCPVCSFLERPNKEHERILMRLWALLDPDKGGQSRARRAVAFELLDQHSSAYAIDGDCAADADYEKDAAAVEAHDDD